MENKNNKTLIGIIITLVFILMGLTAYITYDYATEKFVKEETKENNEEKNENSNSVENLLRRDNFIKTINGKEKTISYLYYGEKHDYGNISEQEIKMLKDNQDYIYNDIYIKILINEKEIENVKIDIKYDRNDNLNDFELMGSDTVHIFKGADKEYFIFTVKHDNPHVEGGTNPLIVNEEGKLIYELKMKDNQGLWVNDKIKNTLYNGEEYYLEEDKLYFIEFDSIDTATDSIKIQEKLLTITTDEVKIVKTEIYEGQVAGQVD